MTPELPQLVARQPATDLDHSLLLRLFVEQRAVVFAAAGLDEQQVEEHLYARMGFTAIDETPLQRHMEFLTDGRGSRE
jgi:hypothetical protein